MLYIQEQVQSLKGIGTKIASLMNKMNIYTIEDLIMHFPRLYEDRRMVKTIDRLVDGETVSVIGEVSLIDRDRYTVSGKHITRIIIKNETEYAAAVWFNQKFIKKNFKIGEKYLFYGKINKIYGEIQITSPEYEKIHEGTFKGILPVYPITKSLSQKTTRSILYRLLKSEKINIIESLPENIRNRFGLCEISHALRKIHFPQDDLELKAAVKRIKFEELLVLQLGLMMVKYRINKDIKGISFNVSKEIESFIAGLPFELTGAQKSAVSEILDDMKSNRQMNRLVQGDVGSGKTVVAAIALFNAVKNGYQGVLMVPTEILAYQHYQSLMAFFKHCGISVQLLSGKISKKQREKIYESVKCGNTNILVGTHAVIQDNVAFDNLGIVITDEQHRFGVRQRALLSKKGANPDVLIMTATPIPRTMALFIYGDLDISVINELPPGRQKISTYAVKPDMRRRVYNFVKKEIKNRRQVYIVCPIIDESETLEVESAVELARKLKQEYLKDVNVGLLHGKMKPADKDSIMLDFNSGKIDVLVSTTVIEVGINVSNATVMVIENADRFGLSTLHQLRGRVGRGQHKSYCILLSEMKTDISKKRMEIMQELDDGFKIAEQDLKLRGTGEFFGTKQHGLPELKLADVFTDIDILRTTNALAKKLISTEEIFNEDFKVLRMKVEHKFTQNINDITFN